MKGIANLRGLAEAERLSFIGDMFGVTRGMRRGGTGGGSPSRKQGCWSFGKAAGLQFSSEYWFGDGTKFGPGPGIGIGTATGEDSEVMDTVMELGTLKVFGDDMSVASVMSPKQMAQFEEGPLATTVTAHNLARTSVVNH